LDLRRTARPGSQGRAPPHAIRSDAPSICGRTSGRACFSRPIFCAFAPFGLTRARRPMRAIGLRKQKIGQMKTGRGGQSLLSGDNTFIEDAGFGLHEDVRLYDSTRRGSPLPEDRADAQLLGVQLSGVAFVGGVMSGRRSLIKGYFWRCAGRGCGHVWTPLADQGLFLALRGSWVRSCLRPSFAENRIRWP
jgi:hypothetical protein